nr:MAG TPA: hypothetical protein [Caudoviricetes sp.]
MITVAGKLAAYLSFKYLLSPLVKSFRRFFLFDPGRVPQKPYEQNCVNPACYGFCHVVYLPLFSKCLLYLIAVNSAATKMMQAPNKMQISNLVMVF